MILNYIKLFLSQTADLFLDMAPYIMLGVLIAGVLHVLLSREFVARHIGGGNFSSVFKASLFGVPLPLCSCGVVPTAVYLKNAGASKSAVTAFLISTPQTGIDSIAATYGMLGPAFAFFKAAAALITGTAGGAADYLLDRKNNGGTYRAAEHTAPEPPPTEGRSTGPAGKLREIWNYAVFELLDDIAVNFIIGLGIAAAISVAIPEDFFDYPVLSNPLVSMVLMVIIGIPMYICSTSSIPIAVALIAKGLSPGAAYVFLVAGPATNAASIAVISKTLGKRTTLRYLVSIIAGSLVFGFIMDAFYTGFGLSPFGAAGNYRYDEDGQGLFLYGVSALFLGLLIFLLFRRVYLGIRKPPAGGNKCGDTCCSCK